MGHIESLEQSLLESRKEWVSNRIIELKNVRAIIDGDFAKGKRTCDVPFVNCRVGYADEVVVFLRTWFEEEPGDWGKVELYTTSDDRNNTDHIVARRV